MAMVHPASGAALDACVDAAERAPIAKKKGKLKQARAYALACADEVCPKLVQQDCRELIAAVDAATPTIVVVLREPDGSDVVQAKLRIDGELVKERLDGAPIALDPGAHTLRVEGPNGATFDRDVVLLEGEKLRRIELTLPRSAPNAPPVDAKPLPGDTTSTPVLPWLFTGVAVVSATGFVWLGTSAKNDLDRLRATCAPNCPSSELDAAKTKATLADVSLGVSVVSLALAAYLFVTHETSKKTTVTAAVRTDGAFAALVGEF